MPANPPTSAETTDDEVGAGSTQLFTYTTKAGHTLTIDPTEFDPTGEAIINFSKANRNPNATELEKTAALLDFMCSALDDRQGAILRAMRGSEIATLLEAWRAHTGAPMGKSLTS